MKRPKLAIVLLITLLATGLMIAKGFKLRNQPMPNISGVTESKIPERVKLALENAPKSNPASQLRKFPFPYDAMLAISSDIDLATVEKFEVYHRFLNTKEQTPYGPGLGLDIGDSAWFYVGSDQRPKIDKQGHNVEYSMSYFQGLNPNQLKDAAKIIHYYKAGWIDSLHTFGDFSRNDKKILFKRDLAVAAWKAMNESGFKPIVWINHGSESNVQNFGGYNPKRPFFNYQAGDDPKSPYYHTDITIANGIRYVWNSAGMHQFAYDSPLFPLKLRDGKEVWGFHRYTHDLVNGKYHWTWETHELSHQLTKEHLDQLVQGRKYSIVTQHLGKNAEEFPFNPTDIQALQLLKSYQDNGKVLIARTVRLLEYARTQNYVRYSIAQVDGQTYINLNSLEDPVLGTSIPLFDEVRGLTFYVDDPGNTHLLLNFNPIPEDEIQRNSTDRDGKKSIGVKWFTPDFTDYTKQSKPGE